MGAVINGSKAFHRTQKRSILSFTHGSCNNFDIHYIHRPAEAGRTHTWLMFHIEPNVILSGYNNINGTINKVLWFSHPAFHFSHWFHSVAEKRSVFEHVENWNVPAPRAGRQSSKRQYVCDKGNATQSVAWRMVSVDIHRFDASLKTILPVPVPGTAKPMCTFRWN